MAEISGTDAARHGRVGAFDVVGDGFYAGSAGAAVVALFFLVVDFVLREPLYTPSLFGSVLFRGAEPSAAIGVDLQMVAFYSLVHGAAFVGFGVLCAAIMSRMRKMPELPLVALFCFLGLELSFVFVVRILAPGVGLEIGHGYVATANVLAAIAMAIWLVRYALHRSDG